jgi:antitoxin YefM
LYILEYMTTTVSGAEFRKNMKALVEATETTHERVVITRYGRPSAVLIAADDLASLEETLAVLSDPELMASLQESRGDIEAGRTIPFEDYLQALEKERGFTVQEGDIVLQDEHDATQQAPAE